MRKSSLLITLLTSSIASVTFASPTVVEAKKSSPKAPVVDEASRDFINFKNNDILHGKFLGFTTSGKIIWKNKHAESNIAFTPEEVRKVIINKGQLTKPFTHTSHVTLTNQDTIPGEITSITDKVVVLKTDFAGEITVPRKTIATISFLPLGDKIRYRGPFIKDEWTIHPYSSTSSSRPTTKTEKTPSWNFTNFSLENKGKTGIVMSKTEIQDLGRITFKVSSLGNIMPSFVLFADMKVPEAKKDDNKENKNKVRVSSRSTNVNSVIGTSLVFRLHYSSSSLTFHGFHDDGTPYSTSLSNTIRNTYYNSNSIGNKFYDIRHDKANGLVFLYSGKRLIGKWDISDYTSMLTGKRIGYANLYYSSSSTGSSVSDIVLSSWNGITEPAISMENDDRDTVLLTNGTDRYSGKAIGIADKKLQLKGEYADLKIPTDKIQSLFLSKKNQKEIPLRSDEEVSLRFYGTGKLTGKLTKGPKDKIVLTNETLGKITVDLSYISSYEFEDTDYSFEITK